MLYSDGYREREDEDMDMDLFEIRAEMRRKPDLQFLVEWIDDDARDLDEAKSAIAAYFEAVEEEG